MRTNQQAKVKTKIILIIIAGMALLGIWYYFAAKSAAIPGKLDAFAQCLKDKGTTFYGAFWCPHCAAQKKLFGSSVKFLPYVECSAPDGNSQLPVCNEKNIKNYPTWDFADGTRKTGEVSLVDLASSSGCTLPQ